MLHLMKGVRGIQKQAFRQHMVNNQKTYASVVSQNTLPQPKTTNEAFTFMAEQLTNNVANVVIQIAQPQVCYPNLKQDTLDLKTSICRKVSNAAKIILNIDITGKDLFESIGSLSAPDRPAPRTIPFKFTSTKVNPVSKTISKASTVLKSVSPPSKIAKATPSSLKSPSRFHPS